MLRASNVLIALGLVGLFAACGGDEFQSNSSPDASAGTPNGGAAGAQPDSGTDASSGGKAGIGSGGSSHAGGSAGTGGFVGTGGSAGSGGVIGNGGSSAGGTGGSGANGTGGSGAGASGGFGGDPGQGGSGQCGQLHDACGSEDPCCGALQCGTVALGTSYECCLPLGTQCFSQACCAPHTCGNGKCCAGAAVACNTKDDCCDSHQVCVVMNGQTTPRCCIPTGSICDPNANACCSKVCAVSPDSTVPDPVCQ